jgi:hypothetical protein
MSGIQDRLEVQSIKSESDKKIVYKLNPKKRTNKYQTTYITGIIGLLIICSLIIIVPWLLIRQRVLARPLMSTPFVSPTPTNSPTTRPTPTLVPTSIPEIFIKPIASIIPGLSDLPSSFTVDEEGTQRYQNLFHLPTHNEDLMASFYCR